MLRQQVLCYHEQKATRKANLVGKRDAIDAHPMTPMSHHPGQNPFEDTIGNDS